MPLSAPDEKRPGSGCYQRKARAPALTQWNTEHQTLNLFRGRDRTYKEQRTGRGRVRGYNLHASGRKPSLCGVKEKEKWLPMPGRTERYRTEQIMCTGHPRTKTHVNHNQFSRKFSNIWYLQRGTNDHIPAEARNCSSPASSHEGKAARAGTHTGTSSQTSTCSPGIRPFAVRFLRKVILEKSL